MYCSSLAPVRPAAVLANGNRMNDLQIVNVLALPGVNIARRVALLLLHAVLLR